MSEIHPGSIIHPDAHIAPSVSIGPYCQIGKNVTIDEDTILRSHVVIDGITRIGKKCIIYPFSAIGLEPQDTKYKGEESKVFIGDNNIIREGVTIHKGTAQGHMETRIGDNNFIMACSHIAHDCIVGNGSIFANYVALAGHVELEDYIVLGAYSGVHQFCHVGKYSFIGAHSPVTKDVVPFSFVSGNRAKCYGINSVGLHRHNFSQETINILKLAIRMLCKMDTPVALAKMKESWHSIPEIEYIIDFINKSTRGLIK